MVRRLTSFVFAIALLASAAACGKSATSATDVLAMVVSSTASTVNVPVGTSVQFQAVGALGDGSSANETGTATWQSGDPTIATVSATGLVTGVAVGSTTITATMSGVAGSSPVTVSAQ